MAFFSNLKISNCGQKGRIVVASSASWYQLANFESDFSNPNSKCLLGCAQPPFVLHRTDASYAFVPNAFITKRRDRPEFFSKEGLWSVVVYWDFVFGAALFVCATRPHCWTGEQLFCHQSHKEKCREEYNLFQYRHYIKYEPYALL